MPEWTENASQKFEQYLERIAEMCRQQGDDADEIVNSLRAHIQDEINKSEADVVTDEAVDAVLRRMGTPEEITGFNAEEHEKPLMRERLIDTSKYDKYRHGNHLRVRRSFFYIFGIIIPAIGIATEVATRMMAEFFWDPMPTFYHTFLLALVPLSLFFSNKTGQKESPNEKEVNWSYILNGYAFAISLIYLLIYLPVMPVMLFATIFFGIGLLGLSPVWSTWAAAKQMRQLARERDKFDLSRKKTRKLTLLGIFAGILLMFSLEFMHLVTTFGAQLALSENASSRKSGMWVLDTFNAEEEILRRCYGMNRMGTRLSRSQIKEFRALHYRLTGMAFNSVPKPKNVTPKFNRMAGTRMRDWDEELVADSEVGGRSVAGLVNGLSLDTSSMDISISGTEPGENGPGIAYMEWILEFNNSSFYQREARCQIQVPPGAVASRLNLWIDGEERDAAFGTRKQVSDAYQEVAVAQSRDPALLTTDGPGRLLLQCFPVMPKSKMRVKIGFTIPMHYTPGEAWLILPKFTERNFAISPEFLHTVWAEGTTPMATYSDQLNYEALSSGVHSLRGKLSEIQLQDVRDGGISVALEAPKKLELYAFSDADADARMELVPVQANEAISRPICLVIDGNGAMKEKITSINWDQVLEKLNPEQPVSAIFAGHELVQWKDDWILLKDGREELVSWIKSMDFRGGNDAIPALELAWEKCSQRENSVVIWLHGQYPLALSSPITLQRCLERRSVAEDSSQPIILSLPVELGPNRLLDELGGSDGFIDVTVIDSIETTLQTAMLNPKTALNGAIERKYELDIHLLPIQESETEEGTSVPVDKSNPTETQATGSRHVLRLALAHHVNRVWKSQDREARKEAAEFAVKTRIVTPMTGAVVLEQLQQYERHGLEPSANPENIPNIPEPEEWALILVSLSALIIFVIKRNGA